MKQVLFVLDCGDYHTPEADETLKYWADLLADRGVKACFNMVGETARVLRDRSRKDIIRSLSEHEIGYHSDFHCFPSPEIIEYLDRVDWDTGLNEVIRTEIHGLNDVTEIFGQHPGVFQPPARCTAPQFEYAMRLLNVPMTGCSIFKALNNQMPVWYANGLNFHCYDFHVDKHFVKEDRLNAMKNSVDGMLEKDKDLFVVISHPSMLRTETIWALCFDNKSNPPRSEWPYPPLRSSQEVKSLQDDVEAIVTYILEKPGVNPVTYAELHECYKEPQPRWFDREETALLSERIVAELTYHQLDNLFLSPAEIFSLIVFSLAAFKESGRLPDQVPWKRPIGPVSRTGALEEAVKIDSALLLEKCVEVKRDMDSLRRMPAEVSLAGATMGPADFLRAAAKSLTQIHEKGRIGKDVIFKPTSSDPSVVHETDLSELKYHRAWRLYSDDFKGEKLIEFTKLQAWTVKPATRTGSTPL